MHTNKKNEANRTDAAQSRRRWGLLLRDMSESSENVGESCSPRRAGAHASLRAVPKRLLDQRWPWLVAAAAIVLVFLSTFIELRMPGGDWDERPRGTADDIAKLRERGDVNVLFILIDMLRADRLSVYGHERNTSPILDRLAATGVRFAHHTSQSSWTKASMASLWTGLYPARTGVTRFNHVLPDDANMPAEVFHGAGFQTVGIFRNGWVAPGFGFSQGFSVYQHPQSGLTPTVPAANPTANEVSTDEGAVEAAFEFLRINGRKRWFMYLHLMDVHEYIYDEESALFGTDHESIYDNSIRHTDSVIGVLLEHLAADGYLDNTIVAIGADHGEAFGERGFDGHAREVFRETTEVPWIIAFPFKLEKPVVVTQRSSNVDVWPTLLDLVGLALPGPIDGRTRLPEIQALARGEAPPAADHSAIAQIDQHWGQPDLEPQTMVAVMDEDHRYVRLDLPDPVEHLFDRRDDPNEMKNRIDDLPEERKAFAKIASDYLAEKPAWGDSPTRKIGELELNQLRALGYALPAAHEAKPRKKKIEIKK
jgi:arylsulfatase A-like enzyme